MAIFDDAYTAVMLTQPFFGQLLTKFKVEPTERFPTLAVSLDTLYYNPTFIESISDDECIAAITHEVMHGMFAHLVEMDMYHESGIGPDGKPYEQDKYNRAADYVINDLIKQNNIGTIGAGWCWDAAYPHTMTPAEIYEALPSNPPKGGGGKGSGQQSHDTHVSDGAAGNQKQNAIQPQDVQSAFETAKALGYVPAGIERLIGSIIRPKHSPWAMLRQAVISAMRGHDTTTWRRLNRHMMSRGVVMPGRTGYACGRVGVVVDTSGSIGDELLQLFGSHMGAILSDAKPREIKVYWTDAKVHRVDTIKSGQELRQMLSKTVPGGGGTDMECGIKNAVDDKCDVIAVLTDGYTNFTKGPKRPVIWAMTTEVQAPYGRNIKIC